MKKIFLIFLLFTSLCSSGQEKSKAKIPLFVSHLSERNSLLTKRKGAPHHNFITKAICFNKKCRAFVGWRNHQQSKRYKYTENKNAGKNRKMDTTTVFQDKPIQKLPPKEIVKPIKAPVIELDSVIVLSDVLFETNSYLLNEQLYPKLDSIAGYLQKRIKSQVTISGHTDNTGKESYNLNLSSQRAEAVAEYFLDKGVNPERVNFEGYGSAKPITSNNTQEGRRKNRRVEIWIRNKN